MIYQGNSIRVSELENGIAELCFDLQGESINKFNGATSLELDQALDALEAWAPLKGVLLTSAKDVFIVGADITEFGPVFASGEEAIESLLGKNNATFNRLEDLPVPTVVAINGYALGGGLEVCLACDFRIMSPKAKIGLPEVKLGILPGWGGTIRLPRLVGLDTAIEWIATGSEKRANDALKASVVDAVVEPGQLRSCAITMLDRAIAGDLSFVEVRVRKTGVLQHNDTEALLAFESSKMFIKAKAGYHYPAPVKAIEVIQHGARLTRDEAQKVETQAFVELSKTPQCNALLGVFLADQYIGKKAKYWEKQCAHPVEHTAVLGAGIMGGGIAYQSAYKNVRVKMKDIAQSGLDLGVQEATKLLKKRVERGRMSLDQMAETLNRISSTLSYEGFNDIDLVVEAVVENPNVKKAVLKECEQAVTPDTVICSNTSTISIDELAGGLKRPENFCGMHFFNPVHAMPLVEVIRGTKTSEATIARTVAYANALGKKAIVVNNCPGFLVNRVLFPYFAGFTMLVRDGADFQKIDKVMERWGLPMGPAYLMDVVGLDTGVHAEEVMAKGYPERMAKTFKAASDVLFQAGRFGQKNQKGFYNYEQDKKGKPKKLPAPEVIELLAPHVATPTDFDEQTIVARLMIPMATELARCLEEGIVETPMEADMALLYGIGFPPFRGGVFKWLDDLGLENVVNQAQQLTKLSPLYQPTDGMLQRAQQNQNYYTLGGKNEI